MATAQVKFCGDSEEIEVMTGPFDVLPAGERGVVPDADADWDRPLFLPWVWNVVDQAMSKIDDAGVAANRSCDESSDGARPDASGDDLGSRCGRILLGQHVIECGAGNPQNLGGAALVTPDPFQHL